MRNFSMTIQDRMGDCEWTFTSYEARECDQKLTAEIEHATLLARFIWNSTLPIDYGTCTPALPAGRCDDGVWLRLHCACAKCSDLPLDQRDTFIVIFTRRSKLDNRVGPPVLVGRSRAHDDGIEWTTVIQSDHAEWIGRAFQRDGGWQVQCDNVLARDLLYDDVLGSVETVSRYMKELATNKNLKSEAGFAHEISALANVQDNLIALAKRIDPERSAYLLKSGGVQGMRIDFNKDGSSAGATLIDPDEVMKEKKHL